MPNGFTNDMHFRDELKKITDEGDAIKLGEFLAWRIYNMSKEQTANCEKTRNTCCTRFDIVEQKQNKIWSRLISSIPDILKVGLILYILASLGFDVLLYKDVL